MLINRLIDAFQEGDLGNFPYKKESHEDIQNLWKENRDNPEIIDLLGLLLQKLFLEMKKQGVNHILWGFDTTLTEAFRHLSSIIETQNWQEKASALKELSILMEAYQAGEDYLKKAVDQLFLEEGGAPFDTENSVMNEFFLISSLVIANDHYSKCQYALNESIRREYQDEVKQIELKTSTYYRA